jgi:hypothetical protein
LGQGAATAGTVKADLMVVESKSRLAEIVGVLALATDLASSLRSWNTASGAR